MAGPVLEAEIYAGGAPARRSRVEEMLANIAAQQWQMQFQEQQQAQQNRRNIAAERSVGPPMAPPQGQPPPQQGPQPLAPGTPSTPGGPPPQGAMGPAQGQPPMQFGGPPPPAGRPMSINVRNAPPDQVRAMVQDIQRGQPGGPTAGAAPGGAPPQPVGWQKPPVPTTPAAGPDGAMVDRPPGSPPQPTVLPPSMMTKPIEQIKAEVMKNNPNIREEDIWPVMQAIVDVQGKQQKGKLDQMRVEHEMATAANQAAKEAREEARERELVRIFGFKPTPEMVNAYFATGDLQKARGMVGEIEKKKGTVINLALEQTPEERAATAGMVSTGAPLSAAVPGWGGASVIERRQARNDAIKQIMEETGKDAKAAGVELANRQIDYVAGRRSEVQLNTMLGATDAAVQQLDFNIKQATKAMDKLPSSDLSPVINAIIRGEEYWTGDPAYSETFFYMSAAAMESARIIAGAQASIAQLHQGMADEARKWANINMTPKSWKEGVAPAMIAEGQNRLETYRKAKEHQRVGPKDETPSAVESPKGIPTFKTTAEAEAAAKAGTIKAGDRIKVGDQEGKWQ